MPFSFPANPTLNQTYVYSGVTWTFNGNGWTKGSTVSYGAGSSGGGGATVTVSNSAPSSASVGQLWIDSDYGDLNAYFSGAWVTLSGAQGIIQPTIATVSGSVRNLWTSNLTIIGNNFGLNSVTVRFSFGTVADVTVLPTTNTQITVQVPSSIYNLAVGTIGTISVIDSFGRQSNGVQKTIEITTDGTSAARAAPSAKYLKELGQTVNGVYWIKPGAPYTGAALQTYCDLTYDGGGWTMVFAYYKSQFPVADVASYQVSPQAAATAVSANISAVATPNDPVNSFCMPLDFWLAFSSNSTSGLGGEIREEQAISGGTWPNNTNRVVMFAGGRTSTGTAGNYLNNTQITTARSTLGYNGNTSLAHGWMGAICRGGYQSNSLGTESGYGSGTKGASTLGIMVDSNHLNAGRTGGDGVNTYTSQNSSGGSSWMGRGNCCGQGLGASTNGGEPNGTRWGYVFIR